MEETAKYKRQSGVTGITDSDMVDLSGMVDVSDMVDLVDIVTLDTGAN